MNDSRMAQLWEASPSQRARRVTSPKRSYALRSTRFCVGADKSLISLKFLLSDPATNQGVVGSNPASRARFFSRINGLEMLLSRQLFFAARVFRSRRPAGRHREHSGLQLLRLRAVMGVTPRIA